MNIKDITYFGWQILKLNFKKNYRVPLTAYITLTNRCNNHCLYCEVYKMPQEDRLTTQALKEIISEMKKCGTRRIQFTGGEPLLRKDLGELITHAKKLNLFVGVSTNGYQVQERVAELKNVDVVFLSYDGPKEIHAQLRGEKSFEDTLTALQALQNHGIQVMTSSVLTTINADAIDDIIHFARKHQIIANFNPLEFFPKPPTYLHPPYEKIKDLALKGEERKKVFRKLIQLKSEGAPIGSSTPYLKNALNWPYDDRITDTKPSKLFQCWAGRAGVHLEADGCLYACGWDVGFAPKINVLEEGFQQAWNRIKPSATCKSCSNACNVESNLIYSLNIQSLYNAFKNLK